MTILGNIILLFLCCILCNNCPFVQTTSNLPVYIPGEIVNGFSIPIKPFGIAATETSNIYPLVIWVTDLSKSLWSQKALLSSGSINSFLLSDFYKGNSHYLFIAKENLGDTVIINDTIYSRFKALGVNDTFLSRILYANTTIAKLKLSGESRGITEVLDSWMSRTKYIRVHSRYDNISIPVSFNVTRLDCYWPYCSGPVDSYSSYRLMDGGDGCLLYDTNSSNTAATFRNFPNGIYAMVHAENCTYEYAVMQMQRRGAYGVIVVTRDGDIASPEVNEDGSEDINVFVTAISNVDGLRLLKAIQNCSSYGYNATVMFTSIEVPGSLMVVDSRHRLQQVGGSSAATLMLASWAAQYEAYRHELYLNLSLPALVVPVFDELKMGVTSNEIKIPDQAFKYGSLFIDTMITCNGLYDYDCSRWDHTVTITAKCRSTETSLSLLSSSSSIAVIIDSIWKSISMLAFPHDNVRFL